MKTIQITSNPKVISVFKSYPKYAREKILHLRTLIIATAEDIAHIKHIEETLKWGEPSYLVKNGSTIRINWKKNKPNQYAIYFKCTSKLVPTFKIIYKDLFYYEGNRAIVFSIDDIIPETELKNCIATGLTYHQVKQLPMLGLSNADEESSKIEACSYFSI